MSGSVPSGSEHWPAISWRRSAPQGCYLAMDPGVEELLGLPAEAFLAGEALEPGPVQELPGLDETWERIRLRTLRRLDDTQVVVLEATRPGPEGTILGLWLPMPDDLQVQRTERLGRALEELTEPGLTQTLQAAVQALDLCFAALVGPKRTGAPNGRARILAHWGLSPDQASALAGEEGLLPACDRSPTRFVTADADLSRALGPEIRSVATLPLADLPGARLVVGAAAAGRFGQEEDALLTLLARLLAARSREGALRREKGRLEQGLEELIHAGRTIEALLDGQGRVVAASPPLERLLGNGAGELVGSPCQRLLQDRAGSAPGSARSRALVRSAARRGQGHGLLRNSKGALVPIRFLVRRISAGRWHASVQLEAGEPFPDLDLAETRMWALGVWTAGLAREWTQLMAGALGGASLALRELPSGHAAIQPIRLLEERAWRAAHLAQQLLELALPDSREGPLDPVALVHEASLLARLALPAGVQVRVAGPLPAMIGSAAHFRLLLHTALLCAAGSHLEAPMSVTLLASGPTGEPSRWRPSAPSETGVLLLVERRGLAMEGPERPLPEQCGLAAAQARESELEILLVRLASRMGGSICCCCDPDTRKQLRIFLPARSAAAVEEEGARRGPAEERSETLLLVEGEEAILEAARESLEEEGHSVLAARDGLEAVALFQRRHEEIGLVIIDLSLPRLGGVEVLRQMRKANSGLKALVTSSYGEGITRQALVGMGVEGYLRKPYGQASLIRKVAECLAL